MKKGLIHIYTGDGKGKTTAAVGLSIRFVGNGGNVLFTQFLKNNRSSELNVLRKLEGIELLLCEETFGFYSSMSEETKKKAKEAYSQYFQKIVQIINTRNIQMLVMDEVIGAYHHQLIDRELFVKFLKEKPEELEVVITGRNPTPNLIDLADYVSEIVKRKHPYDLGILARNGIEQ